MYLEHIKKGFEILRQQKFFIKHSKCAFGQQEVEYLSHIITPEGVKVDQGKIKAIITHLLFLVSRHAILAL